MRTRAHVAVLALFVATPVAAQKAVPLSGLDAYVAQAVKEWNVPGLAIAVVKGDSTLFMKGYGLRELGKPDPVTPNTLFDRLQRKSFTAAAIGMLVEEGRWVGRQGHPLAAGLSALRSVRDARSTCATCCRIAPGSGAGAT